MFEADILSHHHAEQAFAETLILSSVLSRKQLDGFMHDAARLLERALGFVACAIRLVHHKGGAQIIVRRVENGARSLFVNAGFRREDA